MTDIDWTDRRLPIQARIAAWEIEHADSDEICSDVLDDTRQLLADARVVIEEMDNMHGYGETLSHIAQCGACDPGTSKPWFPR